MPFPNSILRRVQATTHSLCARRRHAAIVLALVAMIAQGIQLQAVPEPTTSPAPGSPAVPAVPKLHSNAPALTTLILRTPDGLPIEVELLGLYENAILIRHPSTQREATLNLLKQPKAEQDAVNAEVAKARLSVNRVDMRAQLVENLSPGGSEQIIQQKGRLSTKDIPSVGTDVPASKTLPGGARCLRLLGAVGKDVYVDIHADAYIFWYAKETSGKAQARSTQKDNASRKGEAYASGGSAGTGRSRPTGSNAVRRSDVFLAQQETVPLVISKEYAEYISSPFSKGAYQAWAIIIVNRDNGEIIWKNGSGPLWEAENTVKEILENSTTTK